MNAHANIKHEAEFETALQNANLWRGECIQQFADLEITIGDALQGLADAKPTSKIKRGGQIRQSLNELKRLTSAKGSKVEFVAKSLDEIDRLIDWRAHLTHGVLNVWRGKAGQWLLTLEHRDADGGPVRMHALLQKEADEVLERLAREVERLQKRAVSMRLVLNPKSN